MKKAFLFLSLVLGLSTYGRCQDFYDINTINGIEIIFPQSNWDHILDSLAAAGDEGRLLGTAIINGEQFDSVGVRYKGNSSYNPNQVKNPLNIKLDYVIEDQTIDGYGTLKLSNGFKDPSLVRESMSYEIARKYLPASLSNYAKVTINGQYIGLYTSNQDVDRYFMRTWFTESDRARVKGENNSTLPPGQYGVWRYYGADSTSYFPVYTLESDYGWNELVRFLDTLNNYTGSVEEALNLDRHLWFLAFENLLVNLDSPINNTQNYYIFKDDANRFNPIFWDLNETFGVFANLNGAGPLNLYQLQHLDPFVHSGDASYPILNKILTNPLYKRMYVAHMKTMLDELFANGWYEQRALEIQAIIDAEVQADPNKLYTYDEFLANIHSTVGGGPPPAGMPVPGITELMETRITYLQSQTMFQAQQPAIGAVTHLPAAVTPGAEVWFNATVSNATDVKLGYCNNTDDRFSKAQMYDDGNHHDGSAGDGVYGAMLAAGAEAIRYYIFADNGSACAFSPARAEFEFYTVPVTLELVINEFEAVNESTVADQDGEYDDWVELYNNSGVALSLEGFNITDKTDNLAKWTFPDTTIAAGGYLVVWCDEDSSQAGLHANFKLSSLGELIILSDPLLNVIDEITFGPQKADTTTGRYPNGTGPFILMQPSFGAENLNGFPTGQGEEPGPGWSLGQNYPNPFTTSTTIPLHVSRAVAVSLEIHDLFGRTVKVLFAGDLYAGDYSFTWDAGDAGKGIYVCLLRIGGNVSQVKLVKI